MKEKFENEEEKFGREEPTLSKEEILARSRKENEMSGDERERGRRLWTRNIGFLATVLACAVALIVRVCFEDAVPYELMAVIFTGLAAQNIAEAFITENKKLKALAIIVAVLSLGVAILYWVEFGLHLAGK